MKIASIALIILGTILAIATVVLAIVGIWTGNARYGETAIITTFTCVLTYGVGGAFWATK